MYDFRRVLVLFSLPLLTATLLGASPLAAQTSQPEALKAVKEAVAAEFAAANSDKSIWMYRDHDQTVGKDAVYTQIETREGTLRRMVELDGKPVTGKPAQDEAKRIDDYIHDESAQAKAKKNGDHDDGQAAEMLKMLPDAFIWSIASETPEFVTLNYAPNPKFSPPDMQSRVMCIMGGQMIIARDGNRIRTLRGQLSNDVLIGFGILGRLNKGGSFDVERRLVGGGHWQITETHVHIGGHALIFKTIGQQEDEVKTDWRPSPAETLKSAAAALGVGR